MRKIKFIGANGEKKSIYIVNERLLCCECSDNIRGIILLKEDIHIGKKSKLCYKAEWGICCNTCGWELILNNKPFHHQLLPPYFLNNGASPIFQCR